MEAERKVNPGCGNASNPFHVCAEYCVQRAHGTKPRSPVPKLGGAAQNGERRREDRGIVAVDREVDPSCRNAANPFHHCAEYCSSKHPPVSGHRGEERSENGVKMENRKTTEIVDVLQHGANHNKNSEIITAERSINASCKNASNPYHQCAEYCNSSKPAVQRQTNEKRPVETGVLVDTDKMVDPRCANASNPYHVKRNKMEHAHGGTVAAVVGTGTAHREGNGGLKTAERERVNPNCRNSSNPFHICADYCFQKINQRSPQRPPTTIQTRSTASKAARSITKPVEQTPKPSFSKDRRIFAVTTSG